MGIKIKGQFMNRSAYRTIKYINRSIFFKGQVYEWDRFRNTGSHIRTTSYIKDAMGRGVFILVKDCYLATEQKQFKTNCEIVWMKIIFFFS